MPQHRATFAKIPIFSSLSEAEILDLDRRCTWKRHDAGHWIIELGQEGADVFFVSFGHVRVLIRSLDGTQVILREIHEGEFFGELAAIDGRARSAGILAVTDAVVARMPPAVFRDAVHRYPAFCDAVLQTLSSQLRIATNRLNELATLSIRERLLAELLRLARPAGSDGRVAISPPPTHAEIGAWINARREAVTRELKVLERAGLLEKTRGALVILDPGRLAGMIGNERKEAD